MTEVYGKYAPDNVDNVVFYVAGTMRSFWCSIREDAFAME